MLWRPQEARRLEPRPVLPAGRPAGLRKLSGGASRPFIPRADLHDIAWLRARLAQPDPQALDPIYADGDDAELAPGATLAEAAVLVGLTTGAEPGVLLTKRADALRRHAGQVSFPGGRIDPDDAGIEQAALREAQEEIGLAPALVTLAGRMTPYVTATGYRVTPVVALIGPGFIPHPSPVEVDAVFELPLSILLDPNSPQRHSAAWQGRVRHYWVWPHPAFHIWGATAAILMQLARRLRA